jgi:hypothetical protein
MQPNQTHTLAKSYWLLLPIVGSLLFVMMYVLAANHYPGGNQQNKNAIGFSWVNNYWCNLIADTAINGQPNAAAPYAMLGMAILCISIIAFWVIVPKQVTTKRTQQLSIQLLGSSSMLVAFFLLTNIHHDAIINVAALLGGIALIILLACLYKAKWKTLFYACLFNVILVGLNNYVYYNQALLIYLPIIQKITFASFLGWMCWVCLHAYRSKQMP